MSVTAVPRSGFSADSLTLAREAAVVAGVVFGHDIRRTTPHIGNRVVFLVLAGTKTAEAFGLATVTDEEQALGIAIGAVERLGAQIECHFLG